MFSLQYKHAGPSRNALFTAGSGAFIPPLIMWVSDQAVHIMSYVSKSRSVVKCIGRIDTKHSQLFLDVQELVFLPPPFFVLSESWTVFGGQAAADSEELATAGTCPSRSGEGRLSRFILTCALPDILQSRTFSACAPFALSHKAPPEDFGKTPGLRCASEKAARVRPCQRRCTSPSLICMRCIDDDFNLDYQQPPPLRSRPSSEQTRHCSFVALYQGFSSQYSCSALVCSAYKLFRCFNNVSKQNYSNRTGSFKHLLCLIWT